MERVNYKTGIKELTSLIIILISIYSSDMTPVFLFPLGKNATWMFPILWGIMAILPISASLSLLKLYKNKGLIDIIYHLNGKYIGFIISFIVFLIFFISTMLNSRSYTDILSSLVLPNTPDIAIYLIIMGVSLFIAANGLQNIGRVCWILFYFIVVSFFVLFLLVVSELNVGFVFPIAGPGIDEVVKKGAQQFSIIGEIILLPVIYPLIKSYKEYKTAIKVGLVIGLGQLSLALILFVMAFDYINLQTMPYPFHELIRLTGIERFFANFDVYFIGIWLVASIIRFAFFIYITTATFVYTLRLKRIRPMLFTFTILIVVLGSLTSNPIETNVTIRKMMLLEYSWIFILALPLVLWSIARLKGEYKK